MEHTMLIGMPVYEGVDLLDVTGPYEMFGWADLEVRLFAEAPGRICRNAAQLGRICRSRTWITDL